MNNDPWASAELGEAPAGWILATENGWGALVVWAAGQGNFVRVRAAAGDRLGTVVHRFQTGSAQLEPFVLTEADLESIDDDIDSYLAAAELPPRPRGYDWFIRRPPNTDLGEDAFWDAVWAASTATLPHDAVHPSTLKGSAKEALARMYLG
ncbi:DUF5956 family protein [Arthrobacter sp. ISL-69]|uniref:DUF5956 family protein n=1 Tax=Arthrobacter sp. ISL-69 TaxID=2819113 RepID=UPI001BEB1002|nr:DUF5956 family protein [Arthrobacter sp. ISL-69]MBT2535634.1 hypothetical protein [Arthrobacter sp. ISL-69]